MKTKKKSALFLTLLLLLPFLTKAQTKATEAKAAYLLAEESYGTGEYTSTLKYLEQAKMALGGANSKILYLQIQAEVELSKGNPASAAKLLTLIGEFEKSPGLKNFNEEKTLEVTKTKIKLKSQLADLIARNKQLAQAKADSVLYMESLKKRGKELGGIIVYEKDGHGLIVAEQDLRRGNFSQARNFCDDLVLNGFDDWYLPDVTELSLICTNVYKKGLGQFGTDYYWSSEKGFLRFGYSLASCGSVKLGTAIKYNVRPVRKF